MSFQSNAADSGAPSGTPGATSFQSASVTPNNPATSQYDDKTELVEIDGRKYTLAALVNKVTHADTHIKTLVTEAADARKVIDRLDDLASKQVNMADVLAKLGTGAPAQRVEPTPAGNPASTPSLTKEDVAATVAQGIAAQRAADQAAENFQTVANALTKVYGDKTDAEVAKVAKQHGMSVDQIENLAKSAPSLVLKLFETEPKPVPHTLRGDSGQALSLGVHPTTSGAGYVKSGYWETGKERERTSIYQQKLAEVKAKYGITG